MSDKVLDGRAAMNTGVRERWAVPAGVAFATMEMPQQPSVCRNPFCAELPIGGCDYCHECACAEGLIEYGN